MEAEIRAICGRARAASRIVGPLPRDRKDAALLAIAAGIRSQREPILDANRQDLEAARARGTKGALLDRLALDAGRVEAVAHALEEIAALADPVGETISEVTRPNGLRITRARAPLGVIAIIYEARPNVTAEASALCLKAGNAVVLRGGSEAKHSNAALGRVITEALEASGLPRDAVQLVPFTDHDAVRILVQQSKTIDLAIPRGGEALITFVTENARVPVVQHYKGVCHLFLDAGCDPDMATRLVENGKLSRPGVCNALECLLVDAADAAKLLPPIARSLLDKGCELRVDARALALLPSAPSVRAATEDDWGHEFLDKILAIKIVEGLSGAIDHVTRYGSGHTEAICTTDAGHAERWRREVDAACVVVNASTRFHDGGELGLGAEIGIATSRLHWRGPMGLEALTTMKWMVDGEGQTR